MAGRFRHRVELQRKTTTTDETGQTDLAWQTYASVWCEIMPTSTREYLSQSGDRAEITHTIALRFRADVRPKDRVKYGSRIFDIHGVVNIDERNRFLNLRATENADGVD